MQKISELSKKIVCFLPDVSNGVLHPSAVVVHDTPDGKDFAIRKIDTAGTPLSSGELSAFSQSTLAQVQETYVKLFSSETADDPTVRLWRNEIGDAIESYFSEGGPAGAHFAAIVAQAAQRGSDNDWRPVARVTKGSGALRAGTLVSILKAKTLPDGQVKIVCRPIGAKQTSQIDPMKIEVIGLTIAQQAFAQALAELGVSRPEDALHILDSHYFRVEGFPAGYLSTWIDRSFSEHAKQNQIGPLTSSDAWRDGWWRYDEPRGSLPATPSALTETLCELRSLLGTAAAPSAVLTQVLALVQSQQSQGSAESADKAPAPVETGAPAALAEPASEPEKTPASADEQPSLPMFDAPAVVDQSASTPSAKGPELRALVAVLDNLSRAGRVETERFGDQVRLSFSVERESDGAGSVLTTTIAVTESSIVAAAKELFVAIAMHCNGDVRALHVDDVTAWLAPLDARETEPSDSPETKQLIDELRQISQIEHDARVQLEGQLQRVTAERDNLANKLANIKLFMA